MENNKNKIIVAIDFQDQSLIALEYASYFATIIKADLILIHVLEESGFIKKIMTSDEQIINQYNTAKKHLDSLAEKYKAEHKVTTLVKSGKVYQVLIDTAKDLQPVFILMGIKENASSKKSMVGSNALHVIEDCGFPVLTVGAQEMYLSTEINEDIVLPLDLTKNVSEQIQAAIAFAKLLKSNIRVLTVLREESASKEVLMLTQLKKVEDAIKDEGINCTTKLLKDLKTPIHDLVLDFAKEELSQLIIIMTQNETSFIDHFIGSTAKRFIEKSETPVLSITPWQFESESTFLQTFADPLGIFKYKIV